MRGKRKDGNKHRCHPERNNCSNISNRSASARRIEKALARVQKGQKDSKMNCTETQQRKMQGRELN